MMATTTAARESEEKVMQAIREGRPLSEVSRLYAFYIIDLFGGNKMHAATAMQVDRRTLQRWSKVAGRSPGDSMKARGVDHDR